MDAGMKTTYNTMKEGDQSEQNLLVLGLFVHGQGESLFDQLLRNGNEPHGVSSLQQVKLYLMVEVGDVQL